MTKINDLRSVSLWNWHLFPSSFQVNDCYDYQWYWSVMYCYDYCYVDYWFILLGIHSLGVHGNTDDSTNLYITHPCWRMPARYWCYEICVYTQYHHWQYFPGSYFSDVPQGVLWLNRQQHSLVRDWKKIHSRLCDVCKLITHSKINIRWSLCYHFYCPNEMAPSWIILIFSKQVLISNIACIGGSVSLRLRHVVSRRYWYSFYNHDMTKDKIVSLRFWDFT